MAAEGLNDALDITAGAVPLAGTLIGGPIGGAIGSGVGMGLRAFSQWNRSKHAKVPTRPISMTPQSIIENQQNARQVSSGALADASNTLANQRLQQNQAQGVNAARQSARSSSDIMATLGRLNENTNNSLNNLAQQRYGQRLGGYNMLSQANQNVANYDDRNFAYNQVEPYNQAVQNKQNLLTASNTNFDRAGQFIGQNALGMEYLKSANPDYKPQQGGLLGMYKDSQARKGQASTSVTPTSTTSGAWAPNLNNLVSPYNSTSNPYQSNQMAAPQQAPTVFNPVPSSVSQRLPQYIRSGPPINATRSTKGPTQVNVPWITNYASPNQNPNNWWQY